MINVCACNLWKHLGIDVSLTLDRKCLMSKILTIWDNDVQIEDLERLQI